MAEGDVDLSDLESNLFVKTTVEIANTHVATPVTSAVEISTEVEVTTPMPARGRGEKLATPPKTRLRTKMAVSGQPSDLLTDDALERLAKRSPVGPTEQEYQKAFANNEIDNHII